MTRSASWNLRSSSPAAVTAAGAPGPRLVAVLARLRGPGPAAGRLVPRAESAGHLPARGHRRLRPRLRSTGPRIGGRRLAGLLFGGWTAGGQLGDQLVQAGGDQRVRVGVEVSGGGSVAGAPEPVLAPEVVAGEPGCGQCRLVRDGRRVVAGSGAGPGHRWAVSGARMGGAVVMAARTRTIPAATSAGGAVGGPAVMRAQLARLAEVADLPHVTVQAIPYAAGAHPGMPGSFIVLEFPDPADQGLVYLDSMAGDLFLEDDQEIRRYILMFEHLRAAALRPGQSAALLAEIAQQ